MTRTTEITFTGGPPPQGGARRVICLMSVFNEEDLIAEAIASITPFVDAIWVFDGPYLEYPKQGKWEGGFEVSSDLTFEIVKHFAEHLNTIVGYCPTGRLTEQEKRTLMFRFLKEGDLGFVLDADEICYGDVEAGIRAAYITVPRSPLGVGYVRILDLRAAKDWRPRFFSKRGEDLIYESWVKVRCGQTIIVDLKEEVDFEPKIPGFGVVNLRIHYRKQEREADGIACKEALLKKVF